MGFQTNISSIQSRAFTIYIERYPDRVTRTIDPSTGEEVLEVYGNVLTEGEAKVILDSVRAAEIDSDAEGMRLIDSQIKQILDEHEAIASISDSNKLNTDIASAKTNTSPSAPNSTIPPKARLQAVKKSGIVDSTSSEDLVQPSYRFISRPSLLDNINNLAGGIEIGQVASKSSDQNLFIIPKPETRSKLFIMPEWSNHERNKLVESDIAFATADFVLMNVQEQESEKYQIIETFGEDLLYFYGKRPTVYTFSGNFLNTLDLQWRNNFYDKYKEIIRGTKCAENKMRAYLFYDDVLVEGFILNLTMTLNSNDTKVSPFSFSMFITNQTRIHINLLDNKVAATPSYQYEKKMLSDLIYELDVRSRLRDVMRSDSDMQILDEVRNG